MNYHFFSEYFSKGDIWKTNNLIVLYLLAAGKAVQYERQKLKEFVSVDDFEENS